jgi:peptidoglycan/xylan/chitin deacetylase (PgdA/CDA1 family)
VRRVAPLVVVLIAAALALSACGESVAVRMVHGRPAAPESTSPAPTSSPGQSPSPSSAGARPGAGSPKPKPAQSPSATAAGPSQPAKPQASSPTAANPAPRPAGRRGPGGSFTTTGTDGVALTFDDGPDPKNTMDLLDLLKEQGVKATFCVVGWRTRDHPEVVKRIAAEGHTLCNHSWQHLQDLSERDDAYLLRDLQSTNDAIRAAVPDAKIEYFRAPYGNFTPRLVDFVEKLGMKPIYWSVDDQCWMSSRFGVGPAMINHMAGIVQRDTRPGGIILSHENLKPHTIVAYRSLLPWLKAHFRLIPLPTSQTTSHATSRLQDPEYG